MVMLYRCCICVLPPLCALKTHPIMLCEIHLRFSREKPMRAKMVGLITLILITLISAACAEPPPGINDALQNQTAIITTTPLKTLQPMYFDFNKDGVFTEDEFLQYYVVYDA